MLKFIGAFCTRNYINHFLQPYTIIPSPASPQSWNRYSYVLNNPINASDPSGHKCVGEPEECENDKGKPINGAGGFTPTKKDKESPEEILKKHSDKKWDELTPQQQESLLDYGCGTSCWTESQSGGVHQADALHDPLIYLEVLVVGYGSYYALVNLATINAEASIVSIGTNGLYQKAGFTFFELPTLMYRALNAVGLGRLINTVVIGNQIAQDKPVIMTLKDEMIGAGTEIEIGLLRAAQYIESTANWLGVDRIFQPSTWQW